MSIETSTVVAAPGLSDLAKVQLDERHQGILSYAGNTCGGAAPWRQRKFAEVRDLVALSQISSRLKIQCLDVSVDLRAVVEMRVTVPCLRGPDAPLEIASLAVLGVIYRQDVLVTPQPGFSFVQILAPGPVWHANVSHDQNQVLCLGSSLPVGVPLKEIILMTYGALTMQTVQLDVGDSAGVLNPSAADWWQHNTKKIPLSREPFLSKPEAQQ